MITEENEVFAGRAGCHAPGAVVVAAFLVLLYCIFNAVIWLIQMQA